MPVSRVARVKWDGVCVALSLVPTLRMHSPDGNCCNKDRLWLVGFCIFVICTVDWFLSLWTPSLVLGNKKALSSLVFASNYLSDIPAKCLISNLRLLWLRPNSWYMSSSHTTCPHPSQIHSSIAQTQNLSFVPIFSLPAMTNISASTVAPDLAWIWLVSITFTLLTLV